MSSCKLCLLPTKRIFCNQICYGLYQRQHPNPSTFKRGREGLKGEKNPNWKGNSVGYFGIHKWVRERKPKPLLCEECHIRPAIDLANISGRYLRDITDYQYLCRKCHIVSDGRINNLFYNHSGGMN